MADLPPLPNGQAITQPDGTPTLAFTVYWQQLIASIGGTLTNIESILTDILAAQAAADAAQATADQALRESARINSYPSPSSVLTAADVGATATVTIAAHTRVYPVQGSVDVPDTSVAGGTATGLAFSTTYYVYYDDPTLEDTTPTYVATTSLETAVAGASAGRHYVGKVITPADGAGGTTGTGVPPPGGGGGDFIP